MKIRGERRNREKDWRRGLRFKRKRERGRKKDIGRREQRNWWKGKESRGIY